MTRINLIPPNQLMDQHLLAEWREIKMVPASLRRSLKTKSVKSILESVPKEFTLGKGHVTFFFDKLEYLNKRYDTLVNELKNRGYALYHTGSFLDFCQNIPQVFFNDYNPTNQSIFIIKKRINEKLILRPNWYKFYGKIIKDINE